MVDIEVFNDVPLFALLDADERQVLAQQVGLRQFKEGEAVFRAGEVGGLAYLLQQGEIEVSIVNVEGEVIVVDVAGPGCLVGMSSLLANERHLTSAAATEETRAIEIDRNDLATLLQKKPQAGLDMMTMIEQQLRGVHELMRTRVTRNPNDAIEERETLGGRMADAVARFGGSWRFVGSFAFILAVYVTINVVMRKPWDPYPFILLNLFLSMLAAMQAPVIMMSQNRQDAKDRLRSELDYRVNLKAELEIEELLQRMGKLEQRLAAVDDELESNE